MVIRSMYNSVLDQYERNLKVTATLIYFKYSVNYDRYPPYQSSLICNLPICTVYAGELGPINEWLIWWFNMTLPQMKHTE